MEHIANLWEINPGLMNLNGHVLGVPFQQPRITVWGSRHNYSIRTCKLCLSLPVLGESSLVFTVIAGVLGSQHPVSIYWVGFGLKFVWIVFFLLTFWVVILFFGAAKRGRSTSSFYPDAWGVALVRPFDISERSFCCLLDLLRFMRESQVTGSGAHAQTRLHRRWLARQHNPRPHQKQILK